MKKFAIALLACVAFSTISCETSDISEDDAVYEQGVDRTKIRTSNRK